MLGKKERIVLIDGHAVGRRSAYMRHLRVIIMFPAIISRTWFAIRNMRLQPLIEVMCAHASHDNRSNDEHERDNCETRQRLAGGEIISDTLFASSIHADEFEEEVGQGAEVDEDNDDHADKGFLAGPVSGEDE